MLIARLLLAIAIAVGITATALYFITGNREYLRFISRAFLVTLLALVLVGAGMLVVRIFGVLL